MKKHNGNGKLPTDTDNERAVLASVLIDPSVLPAVELAPHHFTDNANRLLFSAMLDCQRAGEPIDVFLLRSRLKSQQVQGVDGYEYFGGDAGLGKLVQSQATGAHAKHYADKVRDAWQRRLVLASATALRTFADEAESPEELAGLIRQELAAITKQLSGGGEAAYRRITSAELDAAEFNIDYLVDGVLVAGQPCLIAGPPKALKTSLIIDLAISIDRGGKFLGYFHCTRQARVGVMSGESGMATIQETARRICNAAGNRLSKCGVIWSDTLPKFGDSGHVDAVAEFVRRDALEVLVIDPAYLAMPNGDAGNMFSQGPLLASISDVCQAAGCALLLAHHTRKNGTAGENRPPELSDIAWSGFAEFARQWLLVGRRERYEPGTGEHRLWLSVGGSAGHGGLYGVDVSEGAHDSLEGRTWDVSLRSTSDLQAHEQAERENREAERLTEIENKNCRKLREALKKFPSGETARVLRETSALNGANFGKAIVTLLGEGRAEACPIEKGNRQFDGYKPTKNT